MRAVLAEGEPTVRNALRILTTQGLGMQVVGEADTSVALQRQVQSLRPDLVIVAWSLLVAHAKAELEALRSSSRGVRIVVLGPRPETCTDALTAGADAYISMVDAPDVVARVLQTCSAHDGSGDTTTLRRPVSAGDEKTTEPGGLS
jgi:DNA-binding NarL/FixJ family response regulator